MPSRCGIQRASLTAELAVLNDYFPDEITRQLTHSVVNISQTNNTTLAALAGKIDLGLVAFLATRGATQSHAPDAVAPPVRDSTNSASFTTAVSPKRAWVSRKYRRSHLSDRIQVASGVRDGKKCRIRSVSQLISFRFHCRAARLDLWSIVAMFKGIEASTSIRSQTTWTSCIGCSCEVIVLFRE